MSQSRVINARLGQKRSVNNLDSDYSQALLIGKNIISRKGNTYEPRRGFQNYGTGLHSSNILQTLQYKGKLLVHQANNTLYKDNGTGTFTALTGTVTAPTDCKIQSLISNESLYFTTASGLYKLDSLTGTPTLAGCPQAIDFNLQLSGATGYLSDNNYVAYRCVWNLIDYNGVLVTGAPSQRIEILNNSGGTTDISIIIEIPDEITVDYYLEVYRSSQDTTSPRPEDFKKVYEYYPTATDITNGYITLLDQTPDDFRGASLYTNPDQETISYANDRPPACTCLTQHKQYYIMGNIEDKHRVYFNEISVTGITAGVSTLTFTCGADVVTLNCYAAVDDAGGGVSGCAASAGLIEVTTTGAHGLSTDDYVEIYGVTGTTEANGIWKITKTAAAKFTLNGSTFVNAYAAGGTVDRYEDKDTPRFVLHTGGTVSANVEATARSIVKTLNIATSNTLYYSYYLSGVTDIPGQFVVEKRVPSGTYFVVTANSDATGGSFSPGIPTSGTLYQSDSDRRSNAIQASKQSQIEHCPIIQRYDVCPKGEDILGVISLGESTFIICTNGIYRLTGDVPSNFNITEFDMNTHCKGKNSIKKVSNKIYFYADSGFHELSEIGINNISTDEYKQHVEPQINTTQENEIYALTYEEENLYICSRYASITSTENDIVSCYNPVKNGWLEWDIPFECGIVIEGIMYYVEPSSNDLRKERKSFTVQDFRGVDGSVVITAIDTTNDYVSFSIAIDIPINSIISQTVGGITYNKNIIAKISANQYQLNSVTHLTTAAATIIYGIQSEIYWMPNFGDDGMQAWEKTCSKLHILFDDDETNIAYGKVSVTTDLMKTEKLTDINSFNNYPWGSVWGIVWGSFKYTGAVPALLPDGYDRYRLLYIGWTHYRPFEKYVCNGYILDYESVYNRYSK